MDKSLVFDRYYNLSLKFLSYRPRSEKEVRDYLKEKSKKAAALDEEVISSIIYRLTDLKFIDDAEFTKFWIQHRKKAFVFIKRELLMRGISKEVIDEVKLSVDVKKNDEELMDKLINKKKNLTYEKLTAFLMRRGFSYEEIKKHLKS